MTKSAWAETMERVNAVVRARVNRGSLFDGCIGGVGLVCLGEGWCLGWRKSRLSDLMKYLP